MIEKYNLIEHIRLRPGMYIGSRDYWGYSQLLSYLIKDFITSGGNEITLILKENNQLIIECTSNEQNLFHLDLIRNIHTYEQKDFNLSLGVIIGLSECSVIEVNNLPILVSDKGNFRILDNIDHIADVRKVKINFTPDKDIFKDLVLKYQTLNTLLRRFAFLASEIRIKSIDDSKEEKQINIFHYPEGLGEIIDYELEKRFMHISSCFKLNFNKETTFSYSLAVAFIDSWHFKPKIKVYANYEETILGGSLLDGIVQGLKKFFREEALKRQMKVNLTSSRLKKHFLIYASVKGELSYLGSTRSKLGTPKVQTEIKKFLYEELKLYFADNSDKIEEILEAFQDE